MRACPFCGFGESTIQPYHEESLMPDRNTKAKYRVFCHVCFAEGPPATTPEMAEEKWDGLLDSIEDESKFKEALNEEKAPYLMEKNPKNLYNLILDVFENNIAANIYEEDIIAFNQIVKALTNKRSLHKYELYDIVGPLMWEGDEGSLSEEDVELFVEYLYKELTGKPTIFEDMGGVAAPMATLNNTPGVGNAVPASSAGLNTDGPSGSGDSWDDSSTGLHTQSSTNESEYVKYEGKPYEIIDSRDYGNGAEILIRGLHNPYGSKNIGIGGGMRHSTFWVKINDDNLIINEGNLNPYDKIGAMIAKKMGVAQPFKKKDSRTNTIEQNRWEELDENQPDNTQSIDDYVKNPDKVMNTAKKRKVNEADNKVFKIETLDSYQKASVHVPDHTLTSVKKKTKKVNEEESLGDQNALKDIKSKNKLTALGIPFVYKPGPSGKKRVYLKMDVNDAIEQLKKLEWSEVGNNTENTLKKFHDKNGKMELAIYADGKDLPRVTLKPVLENIKIDKLISNSLEPYIK